MPTRLKIGRVVRLYSPNDWFYEGRVTVVDASTSTVDVDYGDWITRYEFAHLRLCWTEDGTYEEVLIPNAPGTIVADYRDAA